MSPATTKNPNGGVVNRGVKEDRPLDPVFVECVVKRDNILSAGKQVKANKAVPGNDDISIEEIPAHAHENWRGIKASQPENRMQSVSTMLSGFGPPALKSAAKEVTLRADSAQGKSAQ